MVFQTTGNSTIYSIARVDEHQRNIKEPHYMQNNVYTRGADCLCTQVVVIVVFTKINTKNNTRWMNIQFVTSVRTLFDFLHDIMTIRQVTIKTMIFTHRPQCLTRSVYILLMTPQSIDDVTMTRQFDATTWIVISNSLDIDFIHGDIRDRSHKNYHLWKESNWIPLQRISNA